MIDQYLRSTYEQMSDEQIISLRRDISSLTSIAQVILLEELLRRPHLLEDRMLNRSDRAYEALDGVVVTAKDVRHPNVCVVCLGSNPAHELEVRHQDYKVRYRFFYTRVITHYYRFPCCEECLGKPSGVVVGNYPTTEHTLFCFANLRYKAAFLAVNE